MGGIELICGQTRSRQTKKERRDTYDVVPLRHRESEEGTMSEGGGDSKAPPPQHLRTSRFGKDTRPVQY